ncbi:endoglucanase [Opitutaceae bacterium TAV1]|nr:endoglucanase [Opitutaceae bacterium TAV1]
MLAVFTVMVAHELPARIAMTTDAPSPPVSVQSEKLLPRFRGVVSNGQNAFKEEDFDAMARLSVNLVRWSMGRAWGKANTDTDLAEYDRWLERKLDELENVLDVAAVHGMKVVVALHSPPGGRYEDKSLRMLYEQPYADHFVKNWEKIAQRFRGHRGVRGFDLVNEPIAKKDSPCAPGMLDYWELQVRAARAIRKLDVQTPIFFETDRWNAPAAFHYIKPVPPDLTNVIYQVHMYEPGAYTHQGIYAAWGVESGKAGIAYPDDIKDWRYDNYQKFDKEMLRGLLAPVRKFQLANKATIYVGEFSAVRWAPGAAQYIEDCISLFEEYGWDWTYHAFREWGGWSVEHENLPYDKKNHVPAREPTDRFLALKKGLDKNRFPAHPQETGAEISETVTSQASTRTLAGVVVDPAGQAVAGTFVMTNTGRLVQTGTDGAFSFTGLSPSRYALKVVAANREDFIMPNIDLSEKPVLEVRVVSKPAATANALITGRFIDKASRREVPVWCEITDADGNPIRWFDVSGAPYGGRTDVEKGVWHQKNKRFWSLGGVAFTTKPGFLKMSVHADGYAPAQIGREVGNGKPENWEIELAPLARAENEGFFKGDFHSHLVHWEKLYNVNIPMAAFLLRAEGYRWHYLSANFTKDDTARVADMENRNGFSRLFLALNAEYPKTAGGHWGNAGMEMPNNLLPYKEYANIEVIRTQIVGGGGEGVAVPVHPFYGHMRNKELPFDLLGAPELIAGLDFYTEWTAPADKTWANLLNKGYKLCRTATSDAAFDVGRTPGTMGATFIYSATGILDRSSIVNAIRNGQTSIGWKGTLVVFKMEGKVCGEVFPADSRPRKATVAVLSAPGTNVDIVIVRNGEMFRRFTLRVPASGKGSVELEVRESEKAWYAANCFYAGTTDRPKPTLLGASSPLYFGDWTPPPPVLANVNLSVIDSATRLPVSAQIEIREGDKMITSQKVQSGAVRLSARVFQRIRVSAEGFQSQETGILKIPAIAQFIENSSEQELHDWSHYEKARALLQDVSLEIALKR